MFFGGAYVPSTPAFPKAATFGRASCRMPAVRTVRGLYGVAGAPGRVRTRASNECNAGLTQSLFQ